jgi:hypothetical protein
MHLAEHAAHEGADAAEAAMMNHNIVARLLVASTGAV